MTPPETIGSTLGTVAAALAEAGFDQARRRARRLVAAALGLSASEVFARLDRMITEDDGKRVSEILARAVAHEPLSRILGVREFWGFEFMLSPDTLDPRPESETVVDAVLARLPDRARAYRILDLGTGSGCLLLALLVGVAGGDGNRSRCRARSSRDGAVQCRKAWACGRGRISSSAIGLSRSAKTFDVVVANPPYVASTDIEGLPPEVRDYDPRRALDGGADGLDAYRAIAAELPWLLRSGGVFAGEFGQGQDAAVAELMRRQRLTDRLRRSRSCRNSEMCRRASEPRRENGWNRQISRLGWHTSARETLLT